jgi:hypothetical protein
MLIILEDWLDFLAMLACWLQLLRWIVSSYGWLAGWLCWYIGSLYSLVGNAAWSSVFLGWLC